MSAPIDDLDMGDDSGQGLSVDDAREDDERPSVMVTARIGTGFAQHSTSVWLDAEKVERLHKWLGRWLEASR